MPSIIYNDERRRSGQIDLSTGQFASDAQNPTHNSASYRSSSFEQMRPLHSDRNSHSHSVGIYSGQSPSVAQEVYYYNNNSNNNNSPPNQQLLLLQQQQQQQQANKKKRVKHGLLIATLAFLGMLVLDGLIQFTDLSSRVEDTVHDTMEKAQESAVELERRLVDNLDYHPTTIIENSSAAAASKAKGGGGLIRRLISSLTTPDNPEMGKEKNQADQRTLLNEPLVLPDERSYTVGLDPFEAVGNDKYTDQSQKNNTMMTDQTTTNTRRHNRKLHTFPIIPRHALQHRQRRELINAQRPIPQHLQEGVEDEMFHSENMHRRRRMYPMHAHGGDDDANNDGQEVVIVDAIRHLEATTASSDADNTQGQEVEVDTTSSYNTNYETGALYQGYGTHYMDIYVGTPPQRQTVIIDTGSSITAFPCSGCDHCGDNPADGTQYHTDGDFNIDDSSTYHEQVCKAANSHLKGAAAGKGVPCDLGMCTVVSESGNKERQCRLAVSYAEGSTWSAVEGNDIVYPAGPHDHALVSKEERLEAGVGSGMAAYNLYDEEDVENGDGTKDGDGNIKEFDWMDFRLKFGCQSKVTGMFRTQLEDGIMGMDNRKGSFWMQLHEHYKQNGYVPPSQDDSDGEDEPDFDPAQFSLCFNRQPLTDELRTGVGSGALTLGGADHMMHKTPMVYAANLSPTGGWYPVRIKAMFLKTGGGNLTELQTSQDTKASELIRVSAKEEVLNGSPSLDHGVIIDSGTTDTYLPSLLKEPFQEAWKHALGDDQVYNNNLMEMSADEVKALPTIMLVLQGHELGNIHNADAIGMAKQHQDMLKQGRRRTEEAKNGLPAISATDVVIAIPPEHYFEESSSEPGRFVARFYFSERYGAQSILGSNVLMGHNLLFDNSRGRIGIAESNCDYDAYVEERSRRQVQVEGQVAEQAALESVGEELAESGWKK